MADWPTRTCQPEGRVQRSTGGSAYLGKGGKAMLAWVGGSLVATILALLFLTVFIGDLRVESVFERTLKPVPAATGSSRGGVPTQG